MSSSEKRKKRKFWEFDPSIFNPGPPEKFWRRYFVNPAKSLLRFLLFAVLFAYPVTVVVLGAVFGGIVFWGLFLGSVGLIGVVFWRLGFAKNFEAWNPSWRRQLVGLCGGFLLAAGFFAGMGFLGYWLFPVFGGLLVIGVVLAFRKMR